MIVEPSPLGPRSRPRRALRVLGLVVPVALLAGVVAVGILGPAPEPAPSPAPPPAATADPLIDVANATPAPSAADEPILPVFPSTLAGLQVHGIHWTLEARNRGLARGVIAIAGYLGISDIPAACRDSRMGIFGAFCARIGVLGEAPWLGGPSGSPDPPGYHLHPQFPVGIGIPSQATFMAVSPRTKSPAVIVLARFNDARAKACVPGGRHCGQELVVERVAWVEGEAFPRSVIVDPALGSVAGTGADLRATSALATAMLAAGSYPLATMFVRPTTIAAIEPHADADAALLDPAAGVWFVRGLAVAGDPSRVAWLIVSATADRILARGSVETLRVPGTFATGPADPSLAQARRSSPAARIASRSFAFQYSPASGRNHARPS